MVVTAYHFTSDKLRDGRPIPAIREELRHDGRVKICASGLHASRHVFDALRFAPGHMLHKVECREIVAEEDDKLVCRSRTITTTIDATDVLRRFARKSALEVIHLWDAPDVVRKYLETGDERSRAAASDAARAAARDAAWDAARDAARDAVRAAARDAARAAASDAARAAARAAARDAVRDAAWDAAWHALIEKSRRRLAAMVAAEFRRAEQ